MGKSVHWKKRIWISMIIFGCIFSIPLMHLIPGGSTNPAEPGFWSALFIAFVPNLISAYVIIKARERYLKQNKENKDNKARG